MNRQPAIVSVLRSLLSALCVLVFAASATFAATVTFDSNTPAANRLIDTGDLSKEGADIIVSGVTVTINGAHSFPSLTVQNGGNVTHAPGLVGGMNLTVSGNVTINSGCSMNVNSAGYGSQLGSGAGQSGSTIDGTRASGGGHGGRGGYRVGGRGGAATDSVSQPTDAGSGGGIYGSNPGGAGGGVIRLNVGGTLTIALGATISANGQNSQDGIGGYSGGGAGGSIWITTSSMTGAGYIQADGGFGWQQGGGGGGGRIVLEYKQNNFSGNMTTLGGGSYYDYYGTKTDYTRWGGAGTIYLKSSATGLADLIVDNGSSNANSGEYTPIDGIGYATWAVRRGAIVELHGALNLTGLQIQSGGQIKPPGGLQLSDMTLNIVVHGSAAITDSGSGLYTYAKGYASLQGLGAGQAGSSVDGTRSGGGGHGGRGGYRVGGIGGLSNDSVSQPMDAGSGGGIYGSNPGGAGGGVIRLVVDGLLNVDNNGVINAIGQNSQDGIGGYSGGGAGGSIWITAGSLTGAGYIQADGGYGWQSGGGGGGGRIAIECYQNAFLGTITALGGGSYYDYYGTKTDYTRWGGAGTVYLKTSATDLPDLIIDNGSSSASGETTPLDAQNFRTVTIKRGSRILSTGQLTASALSVSGQSWIVSGGAPVSILASGDMSITDSSRIELSGQGYGPLFGTGAGGNGNPTSDKRGSGGGHGGKGGSGYQNTNAGGISNDSVSQPTDAGSGGGNYGGAYGGAGGGAARIIVNGKFTLQDSQINVNGADSANRAGGGAGGSIWITSSVFTGNGTLSANGGYGNDSGGGGGGGRIALYTVDSSGYTGLITVNGGGTSSSAIAGDPGTIYQQTISALYNLSSVSVSASKLAGGQSTTGAVTLSAPAPTGGVQIGLVSSNTLAVTVPATVTINAGDTQALFPITTNSTLVSRVVSITANSAGGSKTATLTVTPWFSSILLNPSSVAGGATITGTLTLNLPAPGNGLTVALASSDPALTFPNGATLTLAQGTTTQNFSVKVGNVTTAKTAAITASYLAESRTANVYLNPAGVQVQSVAAAPASVVGGAGTFGVVTLNGPAPSGGSLVALACSDTTVATVPAYVNVPAGQTSASFAIQTFSTTTLKTVLLNATLGVTQIATLTVRLPGVASLALVPAAIIGGSTSVGVVTLDSASSVPITVTLSSNQGAAVPQSSIVIAPGQTGGTFTIATSAVTTATTALLTARANGTAKSQGLSLYPVGTKLAIATLSGVVTLEACVNPAQPITFVLRPTDGTAPQTKTATLASDGSFTLSGVLTQNYTLWIKGAKWLARVIAADASSGSASGLAALLPAGDANDDNSVDTSDFGILVGAYNGDASVPGSGYDAAADFNCDGVVDTTDFGLLVGNYNAVGDN